MMTKQEIRRKMRSILSFPPDVRGEKSARICEQVRRLPAWEKALNVVLFAPQLREPDVELLWAHSERRRMIYPRIDMELLSLYSVESLFDLQPARWEIREPRALPEALVRPSEVDLILVPGVAFTAGGLRCGRGGGFYDRLLASLPATACKVGVCFAEQIVGEVPMEPHDLPVDAMVWG